MAYGSASEKTLYGLNAVLPERRQLTFSLYHCYECYIDFRPPFYCQRGSGCTIRLGKDAVPAFNPV